MITASESRKIARALTRFCRMYPNRVRIRYSGGGDDHGFTANPESMNASGFVCPQQTGKTKNCGTCGLLCATAKKNVTFIGHARKLKSDHPAIVNGTTVFMNSKLTSMNPLESKCVLKQSSNDKLGKKVEKGAWKDFIFLTLTLIERETCPISCPHWFDCYGNNLHRSHRFNTNGLMEAIERDLEALNPKKNYVIRLHVLGDFYSVEYVEFWSRMMNKFSNIRIYGYTAHAVDNSHLFANNPFQTVEVA